MSAQAHGARRKSKTDLIPGPIPVFGYLDEPVLNPLGLALAIRMISEPGLTELPRRGAPGHQGETDEAGVRRHVVALWLSLAAPAIFFTRRVI